MLFKERDSDQTDKVSSPVCQRKTLPFIDGSYLSITEYIKDEQIDYYHYDWYTANKKPILKFHSEKHKDRNYQTTTEPFHIHWQGLLDEKRLANPRFQELASIMEFIRIFLLFFFLFTVKLSSEWGVYFGKTRNL